MTHLGDGMFGSATGRSVQVRTIADCVCKDNRIIHEWLVRDVGAIALHIGTTPQALAQSWLDKNKPSISAPISQPFYAPLPQGYVSHITDNPLAVQYNGALQQFFTGDLDKIKQTAGDLYDEAVHQLASNGSSQYGVGQVNLYWHSVFGALTLHDIKIDHSAHMRSDEPGKGGRPARTATRWIISATHSGDGRFGAASGKEIHIMGINHVEWLNGKVLREWVLIDEVAIWMQVLAAS